MEAGGFGPWRAAPARQVRAEAAPARGRCCNRDADEDSESGGEDVQSPAAPRPGRWWLPGRPQRPTAAAAAAAALTPASWRPPERQSWPATTVRTPATAVGQTVEAGAATAEIMKMQSRAGRQTGIYGRRRRDLGRRSFIEVFFFLTDSVFENYGLRCIHGAGLQSEVPEVSSSDISSNWYDWTMSSLHDLSY